MSSSTATVAGGYVNTASAVSATVAGGMGNTASGPVSTVAGGENNTASGHVAAVGGGSNNDATAVYATVPGGFLNAANGDYSFAAGRRAKATHGSFVWADANDVDFGLSAASTNRFAVRATGGIHMVVAINPVTGNLTQSCDLIPGIVSWQCSSDRNAKENFLPIDARSILQRLVEMPLSSWNFKGADPKNRLLGPIAQDFHAAFGLGDDLTIINTNLHGVAYAAIQGLHQLVQKQNERFDQLAQEKDTRIAALEQRLSELETIKHELATLSSVITELQRGRQALAAR